MGKSMPTEHLCKQPTKSGSLCQNPVAIGSSVCAAQHKIPTSRWSKIYAKDSGEKNVTVDTFDAEDLIAAISAGGIAEKGAGEVGTSLGHEADFSSSTFGDSSPLEREEFGFTELAEWAKARATSPEVVRELRDVHGITPYEAATPVISSDGESMTLIEAVEAGEIESYDAPLVASTWPGKGWTFEGDQCQWSTEASVEELANIYRSCCADPGASDKYSDDDVAAQLAGAIGQLSSTALGSGADMVVRRSVHSSLNEDSFSGTSEEFISEAARTAERTLRAERGQDPFSGFRHQWLGQLTTSH